MRKLCLILGMFALMSIGNAQTPAPLPNIIVGCGASYSSNGSPNVAGTCVFAKLVSDKVYSFNGVDLLPVGLKAVDTSVWTGVATQVGSFAGANLFALAGTGVQTTAGELSGPHVGWGWNAGFAADKKLYDNWGAIAALRVDKGTATAGTGYRFIASLGGRWGK